jgi:hypothetical protein
MKSSLGINHCRHLFRTCNRCVDQIYRESIQNNHVRESNVGSVGKCLTVVAAQRHQYLPTCFTQLGGDEGLQNNSSTRTRPRTDLLDIPLDVCKFVATRAHHDDVHNMQCKCASMIQQCVAVIITLVVPLSTIGVQVVKAVSKRVKIV